ncbi:Cache sensor hybrid histidine kinase [Magnetococcus marinus MC-1]|uniref:histidine kinase n=1 Tax=Magnetococcus marinus (strain ATCC BAA-1437 / JCM 17883 / MC-1) TaxID=156889 RepID=A0L9H0_MAGMM|nr:response regulator [Magnetococcus marinus]ABK44613.1 Cache sensor hybrid histidine kinase [Magnetococcus marinus MC-1]
MRSLSFHLPTPFSLFSRLGVGAKFTLLFYMVVLLSLAAVGFYGYSHASKAYREKAQTVVANQASALSQSIANYLSGVPKDLHFVSNYYALNRYLYWNDLGVADKTLLWKNATIDTFRALLEARNDYLAIDFLDNQGVEQIHVHSTEATNEQALATTPLIPNREQSDYFTATHALPKDGLYVSALTLNKVNDKIEKPVVPVIRFAQPVYGKNGVKYGVMVIHVLANAFLDFIHHANMDAYRRYYLVSPEGYYLYHPEAGKSWGHLLNHSAGCASEHPQLLAKIKDLERGSIDWFEHLVSFQRIYPDPHDRTKYWFLLGFIDSKEALVQRSNFVTIFFIILALTLLAVVGAIRYSIGSIITPMLAMTEQLEQLGQGKVTVTPIHYPHADEMGRMIDSTQRLMQSMQALTDQANAIALGNYAQRVKILSQYDVLGNAINNMSFALQLNEQQQRQREWHNENLNRLTHDLSGDLTPETLAQQAITLIGEAIQAGRGGLYIYDDQTQPHKPLLLVGRYMFTQHDEGQQRFSMNEGTVGQAAAQKKPILLECLTPPADQLSSGVANFSARNSYTLPLLYEDRLQGVLEVATLNPLNTQHRQFLDAACQIIAATLFTSLQRERIANLLVLSKAATQRAEAQSHQLQLANAQLEEQQQQLQQQTEELQQSNTQMEHQQQLLQQQAEELRINNEALQHSQHELNQRAIQLEEASQFKSDFLANMSHELRTPLNAIILISNLMSRDETGRLDQESIERTRVIYNAGNDLLRLINDILDLSKVEAGRMEVHLETVHSQELVEELEPLFRDSAQEKKIELRFDDQLQGCFTSDHQKVVQILRNLLSNAIKFTAQGSVILRLAKSDHPQYPIRLSVTDTGIGISKDKMPYIFEAFRQMDGSISRQYGGTGLGLAITHRFATLLKGEVELHSEEGKGSQFTLLLPLAHPHENTEHGQTEPNAPLSETNGPTAEPTLMPPLPSRFLLKGRPKILVIDDDLLFVENISYINQAQGLDTLSAHDGREGLRVAKSHHPVGIILDLGLPDMRGEEVLEQLKRSPELRHIPVYIISAKDKQRALVDQGAIGFLQKPVNDAQIATAQRTLLQHVSANYHTLLILEGPALQQDLIAEKAMNAGMQQLVVQKPEEVLAKTAGHPFDLFLTDYDIEGMTCVELCQQVRQHQPELPIIIYSSRSLNEQQLSELHDVTEHIIQQAPKASDRVLRSIERFLTSTTQKRSRAGITKVNPFGQNRLEGHTILAVDDDPRNLFVLTASLEQNGAEVHKALNGLKALEILKQHSVDLILMDIMMPEMNGYEAIHEIRANPSYCEIPIIALTAKALKEDKQKCLDAGANDYLSKPVDYEILINMVQTWIKRTV